MNGERSYRKAIFAVVALAFVLRAVAVFDVALPYSFYGDEINNVERSVNFYDGTGGFDLNPHWFNKPALGYYANFFVFGCRYLVGRHVTGEFDSAGEFGDAFLNYERGSFYVIGRLLQALYGAVGVFLVWRIGRQFGGARIGLLAAVLLAVCPGHVAFSQQVKNDALAAIFLCLGFLGAQRVAERGLLRDHLWAAAWVGLGWATKYTPAAMLAVIGVAHLMRPRDGGDRVIAIRVALLVPAAFLLAGFVGSPYNFLDPVYYQESLRPTMQHFVRMVFGAGEVESGKYSLFYLFRYAFWMTSREYAFTMPLTVLAFVGLVFGLKRADKGKALLLVVWLGLFYFLLASANMQRTRPNHLMVVYPALAVAAALGLDYVVTLFAARFRFQPSRGLALVVFVLLLPWPGSPGGGLFERARELGTKPPQLRAMEWVWENIPAGTTVVNDGEVLVLKPTPERYGWIRRRIDHELERSTRALATERERERSAADYDREVSERIIRHHEGQLVRWGAQRKRFAYEAPAARAYRHPRYDVLVVEKPWQSEKGDALSPYHGYNAIWERFPLPDLDMRRIHLAELDALPPVERYRRSPETLQRLPAHQRPLHPLLEGRPVDFWISSQESFDNYDKDWKRREYPEWSAFYDDLRAHYDAVEIPGDPSLGQWSIRIFDLRRRMDAGARLTRLEGGR